VSSLETGSISAGAVSGASGSSLTGAGRGADVGDSVGKPDKIRRFEMVTSAASIQGLPA